MSVISIEQVVQSLSHWLISCKISVKWSNERDTATVVTPGLRDSSHTAFPSTQLSALLSAEFLQKQSDLFQRISTTLHLTQVGLNQPNISAKTKMAKCSPWYRQ